MSNSAQKLSLVVPVYNEEKSVKDLVLRVNKSLSEAKIDYEIIFVNDASTDKTEEIVNDLAKKYPLVFIRKKGKKGKAYSLYEGIEKAKYDIVGMIDADLQYPPEVIPQMIEELKNADVVVANRKKYEDSKARKLLSKTFRYAFGKRLFGLDHDIQSGLKIFNKEVFDLIKFLPKSPWTFDLEFLHRATQAGFRVSNFDIAFSKRKHGKSKIGFIGTTLEIGFNALRLKSSSVEPVHIPPTNGKSMSGAGIGYKKNRYITHTTIPHNLSALKTFTKTHKLIIALILALIGVGIFLNPLLTLKLVVGTLSAIYFIDVFFNLFLISRNLDTTSEISSTDKEIEALDDSKLPVYSILCPLYKEAQIIPQFLDAISKISWPKEKLDVMLLLEEDDKATIEAAKNMNMPSYVRILIVPESFPKTKPKACNYGLAYAKGEYLVIYDAEDIPDTLQLKKAYLAFGKTDEKTICLQAKLNYYNPHQNLLTRFFTAEYSLWFDVTLPGLQSFNTALPLGGTSNHFKTKNLIEVEGWDPFNVTEDADLGVRLFKKGYKTAMIDSVTLEEANSRVKNWFRQRSRWIKGYMQTYLVHTRGNRPDVKMMHHALIFQLVIGGKIAFVLINPFLWLATFAYFALYAFVGPAIEAVYPSIVFYMAITSLVLGNFLFLYYYMIGLAKKGQWNLIKFVFLIPIYWFMISISACIALYQLIFKPHYWEKTVHGLHLKEEVQSVVADVIIEKEERSWGIIKPAFINEKIHLILHRDNLGAMSIIASNVISGFLAFAFNAYLGRALSFEDFALVGLINGLISLVGIIFGSLGTTMTHRAGYLMGNQGEEAAIAFWAKTRRRGIIVSIFLSIVWIFISPFLLSYFNLSHLLPLLFFSPIILVSFAAASDRGLLFSKFNFKAIAILNIVEPLAKFCLAIFLVYIGLKTWTYAAIPISVLVVFLIGWKFVYKNKGKIKNYTYAKEDYKFPAKFFLISLFLGISSIIFLNLDVILAKHYLSSSDAGIYALTALIGKTIFFLGALASPFTMSFVSRNEGANKDSSKFLKITILATLLFTVPAFTIIALFGHQLIPMAFGTKAIVTLPYLTLISFAMVCYSVSRVFADYYLAKKYYSFPVVAVIIGISQLVLIDIFHNSISSFVNIMSFVWISYFIVTLFMHMFSSRVKIVENNVNDFLGLFSKLRTPKIKTNENQNILIFNWRDTKHKWAGGAETYVQEIAKRWVAENNSVTIFSGNSNRQARNEIIDGVQIYRRGGFFTVYVWAFLYYILKFRGKYDVIIDCENGIPFFTPLYTRAGKYLLIHHVHQEVFRKSLRWPLSSVALFLEARLMPLVYRNVQVVTVSPSSKEAILKHKLTKKEPIIIYNGVDLNLYKPLRKSEKPLIIYLGRLQYYKSLHIFIIAAKRILKKVPDAQFVIAGEGEERSKLEKFVQKLKIEDKVRFVGKVSEAEKIALYQKAWVFVNPSYMEGWGLTTIEAAACGTPAVASDVPGLRDSIVNNKTGFLVTYKDYQGFANAITKLIKNKRLRRKVSREAVMWANNFSWDKSANSLFAVINEDKNQEQSMQGRGGLFLMINRITSLF